MTLARSRQLDEARRLSLPPTGAGGEYAAFRVSRSRPSRYAAVRESRVLPARAVRRRR